MMITAAIIIEAIDRAQAEVHAAFQAYVDADDVKGVILDGHFDFHLISKHLTELARESITREAFMAGWWSPTAGEDNCPPDDELGPMAEDEYRQWLEGTFPA